MSEVVSRLQCNGNNPITIFTPELTLTYFSPSPTQNSSPFVQGGQSVRPLNQNPQQSKFLPVTASLLTTAGVAIGYVFVSGNNQANGQRMLVQVGGSFGPSAADQASPTVKIQLDAMVNPYTYGAPNGFGVSYPTAVTLASATITTAGIGQLTNPFTLSCNLFGTNDSGIVEGNYTIQAAGNSLLSGNTTNLSNIVFSNPLPFALAVGVTFSGDGVHANAASLFQFELSL